MGTAALFGWVHLSDVHIGHGGASHVADQELVLRALREDVAAQVDAGVPAPDVVLVTGDIAFSGATVAADEYERAAAWLDAVAAAAGVGRESVFVVPGNHDVQRAVDKDSAVKRLMRSLRSGDETVDEALDSANDRALLAKRQAHYLAFAERFAPAGRADAATKEPRLYWHHARDARGGLRVRLCGLNTALLAADEAVFGGDRGALRLGKRQLADVLPASTDPHELVVVLSHHPFVEGWLHDEKEARGWTRGHAHVHLSGHVHDAANERTFVGAGVDFVHVAAGAAHGEAMPAGAPAQHGYSFGAVIAERGGVALRVWPRRWSEAQKRFRRDLEGADEARGYATHAIARVKLPKAAAGKQVGAKPPKPKAAATSAGAVSTSSPAPPPPATSPSPAVRMAIPLAPTPPTESTPGSPPETTATSASNSLQLSGAQCKELCTALKGAFPSTAALAQMVLFALDENLATIAPNDNLNVQTFELVSWAQARGFSRRLIEGALGENPTHPGLTTFASSVGVTRAATHPPSTPRVAAEVPRGVAEAEAQVLDALRAHPRVVASLARQGLGDEPAVILRAILHEQTAHAVMIALCAAADDLELHPLASKEDQLLLDRVFNECVRFSVDWRATLTSGRAALRTGANSFALPTRKDSVTELILAGINDRLPAFDLTRPGAAVGLTRVDMPPALRGPVALTSALFTEAMVKHIAGTVFVDNPDLAHARTHPGSAAALAEVEGTLRARGFEGSPKRRCPYYVSFADDASHLWQVACGAQAAGGLQSLQLVRWDGPADPTEAALVDHIKTFLHRSKP